MRAFIEKLAARHRLQIDLQYARLRLAQAEAAQPLDSRIGQLQKDVRCLERACDQALAELQIAADAYKAAVRHPTARKKSKKDLDEIGAAAGPLIRSMLAIDQPVQEASALR
jgi:hypothetical protein